MKRFLIITPIFPPEIGGPASYVPELATRLSCRYQVTVITFCSQTPVTSEHYRVVRIKTSGVAWLRQLRLAWQVLRVGWRASIWYIQGTLTVGLVPVVLNLFLRKRLLLKFVGDEVWESYRANWGSQTLEGFYQQQADSVLIRLHRWVLYQVNRVVTPSKYLRNFLTEFHRVAEYKVKIIPNPLEIHHLSDTNKTVNQLVFVGRLVTWKHVDQMVSVLPDLPEWRLKIIGTGPQKAQLHHLVSDLGVEAQVDFLGRLSHQQTLTEIEAAQALVLLSEYEGQSHVLIEAMLLGTPVIASDIAANRELVGHRGILVEPGNRQALVTAVSQMSDFRQPNIRSFQQRHSWRKHIELLEELFTDS